MQLFPHILSDFIYNQTQFLLPLGIVTYVWSLYMMYVYYSNKTFLNEIKKNTAPGLCVGVVWAKTIVISLTNKATSGYVYDLVGYPETIFTALER